MNLSNSDLEGKGGKPENADIDYILSLFDNQELGLTLISEDTEDNERHSTVQRPSEQAENHQEVTDGIFKSAFTTYFKSERREALEFVDAAIRFMNCIRKMKIEEVMKLLSEDQAFDCITDSLITPELLLDPIEDRLIFDKKMPEGDRRLYE
jgi:hypothetical protein